MYQDKTVTNDGHGNCFTACLASIFEIPLKDMPNILPNTKGDWWHQWRVWLADRGMEIEYYYLHEEIPKGYGIATVETERTYPEGHRKEGQKISHVVVVFDGVVVHDPYPIPGKEMVIKYYQMIEPMDEVELKLHRLKGVSCIHGYKKDCDICKDEE